MGLGWQLSFRPSIGIEKRRRDLEYDYLTKYGLKTTAHKRATTRPTGAMRSCRGAKNVSTEHMI